MGNLQKLEDWELARDQAGVQQDSKDWLLYEREAQRRANLPLLEASERAAAAAERAAVASDKAAEGSLKTARYTLLIAIATFLVVLVTAWPLLRG